MKWKFAVRAATFALLFACSGVGSPAADGGHPALANLDGRQAAVNPARPSPDQALAHARLRTRLPQVRIAWETVTGSPRFIHSRDGFLTGLDGQGRAVGLAQAFDGDANHAPIKAFIGEHPDLFGHGPELLEESTLAREFVTAHNGLHTVVWQQEVEGIPVFGGLFIGHVTRNGELVSVSSGMVPEAAAAARRGTPRQMALGQEGLLPARQALAIGAASLGATVTTNEAGSVAVPVKAATPSSFQTLTLAGVRGEAYGRRVWLPMDRITLRLCWELILTPDNRTEMYRLLVDAETGEVLIRHSLTEEISEATYHVFTSDSPTPFTPGHSVPSTTQPPVVSRMPVTLGALSTNASPAGWIPEGVNETRGNNVRAHTDHDNNNQPDLPRPEGSPFRVFNPPLELDGDPRNYSDAAVVQLFFWCNWMHDRLYELGFTEAAGNFQESNFGRGGIGGDPVDADAQDGGGFNNANFATPPEGLAPRMQMYLWNGPTPPRDAALDADIILHEYTHGLSNRRVGGGVGITALQSRGLGEGWSDFYAASLLSEPGDDPHAVYPAGGYSSYRLRGLTENYYFGIRRYPYSTDLSKNPLTFKDIDPDQISSHPGVPISPTAVGEADGVHRIGEVWCVMLWEARANLIDKYGFETGNELILQLVTDALNLTPPNPTFVEARDAILLADLINHAGVNYVDLWSAFAKRGLGAGSIASASDTTRGVQEAFDLPDDLLIVAPLGLTARGPVGGPFIPSSRTYALTNIGNENLTVDIAKDAEWLSLSLSSATLQPGGPARQTVAYVNPLATTLSPGSYPATVTISNSTSGVSQSFAWLLEVRPRDYFTEAFPEGDNDVSFQTLTFLPDDSASQYSVCRAEAVEF
ncbi:MAG TPA: extracellular metalloproteinase, partial [Methylomirabilota bacterium]|nr:extracellular metalloproteinase [Methylomirabilota bacterium]